MRALRAALLALACLAPARPAAAQAPADTLIPSAALLADAAILRRAYLELHPGLWRYNSPEQLEAAFAALEREYARDRTLADAYRVLSQFLAKVRCGHTYANFWNQRDDVQAALFDRRTRVPFEFTWLGRRMVVTRWRGAQPALPAGTEVLAIDGVPAGTILDSLMTVARADGGNDAKRVAYLAVTGNGRWEAFDIFHPLFFPRIGATLRLDVREPRAARPRTLDVAALADADRVAAWRASAEGRGGDSAAVFTVTYPQPRTAVLRMPTWALYNSKWDWKGWLQARFEEFDRRGVTGLVVDLRDNEGGLDVGHEILSHLVTAELRLPTGGRWTRYRTAPADLAPYLDTWDRSFLDWGEAAKGPHGPFYRLVRNANDEAGDVVRPAAPHFRGQVLVLVGAANSSATFQFASAIQRQRLGRLVGQPTGGNQRGINGGAFFFLRLPKTGLEADLPLIASFAPEARPDAGIEPDVPVAPTVAAIAAGRDLELETALRLLR